MTTEMTQLRERLAREGRVVLAPSFWFSGVPILFGALGVVVGVTSSGGRVLAIGLGIAFIALGFALRAWVQRPVVVDAAGVHAAGPLGYDVAWGDITDVLTVSANRPGPTWVVVAVEPGTLRGDAVHSGLWRRTMYLLSRVTGVPVLQLPHLQAGADVGVAFLSAERAERSEGAPDVPFRAG